MSGNQWERNKLFLIHWFIRVFLKIHFYYCEIILAGWKTKDYFFEAVNKTDSSVTMRLAADRASYIDFIYTMKPDSYLMNFEIKATGMEDKLASTKSVSYTHLDVYKRQK